MICRATPYEGKEPYIFFSYCRQDSAIVYSIIEKIADAGFRIWFDDGIHPGDDWPETIADHINRCSVCIAAVSKAFSASHNCRNEMTYVIGKNIPFIPIVLEDFQMTAGMAMQLGGSQYIRKFEFADEGAFFQKLFATDKLKVCLGERRHEPHVHTWSDWEIVKKPSCTEAGEEGRSCGCGQKETRKIPAAGHKAERVNAADPTCTGEGYSGDMICSVCGVITAHGEPVPALGHVWSSWIVKRKPGCVESGEEARHCDNCGKTEAKEIPATGHELIHVEKRPAAADADGNKEYLAFAKSKKPYLVSFKAIQ